MQNQVLQLIIGMSRLKIHFKVFAVVIRTILKDSQEAFPVSRIDGLNFSVNFQASKAIE